MLPLYLLRPGTWFRFAEQYNDRAIYAAEGFAWDGTRMGVFRVRLIGQPATAIALGVSLVEIYNR